MKEITFETTITKTDSLTLEIFNESALFYDIETTGFSAKTNKIYFIGCACRKGTIVTTTQFFSETAEDEAEVLLAFCELCRNYRTTITFNGLGFDLPFILERCKKLQAPEYLSQMEHIDIFKQIAPLKKMFGLTSMKQKSIETFLGIHREDLYSGGELIPLYYDYLNDQDEETLYLLQLHNKEDVLGMIDILPILSYLELLHGNFEVTSMEENSYQEYDGTKALEIIFSLKLSYPLPKPLSCRREDIYLSAHDNTAKLRVKAFQGELKHFYPNYKDYYYLPQEDMAVHKSVAEYVAKEFRVKAKASTCYTKKESRFLPQHQELYSPCFKMDVKDKYSYFELNDDFNLSKEMQKSYALHLLNTLAK